MRLTESTVFQANYDFIRRMAEKYGRGIEQDDCFAIASEGFLYAVRTYRKSLVVFHCYAEQLIRDFLCRERKKIYQISRIESPFSLDQPLYPDTADSYQVSGTGDFVNGIMIRDFLSCLEPPFQRTAQMYIDRYTTEEIMALRGLTWEEMQWHINSIRYDWENYDEMPGTA